MKSDNYWKVCQLGAREHYAIPQALQSLDQLDILMTDAWVPPGSVWGMVRRNLRERHHALVPDERVRSSTTRAVGFELMAQARRWQGWERILKRNWWFQRQVTDWLDDSSRRAPNIKGPGTLFSYSYTARRPFEWAKQNGWKTVLGQIDGAIGEEKKITRIHEQHQESVAPSRMAPAIYWQHWREECELADKILVNSEWSRDLLTEEGISADKLEVIPLAYNSTHESDKGSFMREYPSEFSETRPLRVLFLGQVSVRKGVIELLEAARLLISRPVEFWMVGPEIFRIPDELRNQENIRWMGAVPRSKASDFYKQADVFIFPTHSDGFGLTQLEAQAWGLPIIASTHCGRVVQKDVNGLELPEVSAVAIVDAVENCLNHPDVISEWSREADDLSKYSIEKLAARLYDLA